MVAHSNVWHNCPDLPPVYPLAALPWRSFAQRAF